MRSALYSIRAQHGLPAIAAVVIKDGKIVANEVVGSTRISGHIPAKTDSKWHLDACARPMTVMLLATLVEEGKLTWDTKFVDVFPEVKTVIHPGYTKLTLRHLIANRSGLPQDLPKSLTWKEVVAMKEPVIERRRNLCYESVQQEPAFEPGTEHRRSRIDFLLAGAMAERVTGLAFETMMQDRVLGPLGMASARFGEQNYEGGESQPLPHEVRRGRLISIDSGVFADLPDAYSPAGTLHMTLEDWAKFVAFQLDVPDAPRLLSKEMREQLQRPEWHYDWGTYFNKRDWAYGHVSVIIGSNGLNYAAARIAPRIGFAMLIVSNAGSAEESLNQAYIDLMAIYMPGVAVRQGEN
jgi:CubicO group peptidase (beta-lactamase class C family)